MSDICLTDEEIEMVTRKTQHAAQARELNRLGIDHKVRSDGSVLVFRSQADPAGRKIKKALPDFECVTSVA